jgi:two-component sensor histidine kinase
MGPRQDTSETNNPPDRRLRLRPHQVVVAEAISFLIVSLSGLTAFSTIQHEFLGRGPLLAAVTASILGPVLCAYAINRLRRRDSHPVPRAVPALTPVADVPDVPGAGTPTDTHADQSPAPLRLVRQEEHDRLRRDLHDGLSPALAAVVMRIETARAYLGTEPAASKQIDEILAQAHSDVREAIADVRQLAFQQKITVLKGRCLGAALRQQAARFEQASGGRLAVTVDLPPRLSGLSQDVEYAIYWIVSEALANVAKHANASTCRIRLYIGTHLHLEIVDDGTGLRGVGNSGLGLTTMRERAQELGGNFVIQPMSPHGTGISVCLPVPAAEPIVS